MGNSAKSRWDGLSLRDKSDLMRIYIRNGITSLEEMRSHYNGMYAEGGDISPDWDPDNPYNYETEDGRKVVISPEVFEANKGKSFFREIEAAVKANQEKYQGPVYDVDEEWLKRLEDVHRVAARDYAGFRNYKYYGNSLPDGWRFTDDGMIVDGEGNYWVQRGLNLGNVAEVDDSRSYRHVINAGKPIEDGRTYYPVVMKKVMRRPKAVDRVISQADIDRAKKEAEESYVKENSKINRWPIIGVHFEGAGDGNSVIFGPLSGFKKYGKSWLRDNAYKTDIATMQKYDEGRGNIAALQSLQWLINRSVPFSKTTPTTEDFITGWNTFKTKPKKEEIEANVEIPLYSQGGSLGHITPYGQWWYPGEVTTIPGNDITMKGVNYPVLGVSNKGDRKLMMPGRDYKFRGDYVTEYPMFGGGGHLFQEKGQMTRWQSPFMPSMASNAQPVQVPYAQHPVVNATSQKTNTPQISRKTYQVTQGDTMWGIAKKNNMTVAELLELNPQIENKNRIEIGQTINLEKKKTGKYVDIDKLYKEEEKLNKDNLSAIQGAKHKGNYIVIDKAAGTLTVFDKHNNPLKVFNNVHTGKSGNDYNTVTYTQDGKIVSGAGNESTPAGISIIRGVGKYHGAPSYIRSRVDTKTGGVRTIKNSKGEDAPDDIASSIHYGAPSAELYVSNGCARMSTKQLEELGKYITPEKTMVYTLPTNDKSRFRLSDGKLDFVADNTFGSQEVESKHPLWAERGENKYDKKRGYSLWDDYNTNVNLEYSPMKIRYKRTGNKEYDDNKHRFTSSLVNNKRIIMETLNSGKAGQRLPVTSKTYNILAQIAVALAENESQMGTAQSYKVTNQGKMGFKRVNGIPVPFMAGWGPMLAKLHNEWNGTGTSQGMTQIKMASDNEEVQKLYKHFGLTESLVADSPEASAAATMIRLIHMYNNETGGNFYDNKGNKMDRTDVLLYKYIGQGYKLAKTSEEGIKKGKEMDKNSNPKGASPETNTYIKRLRENMKKTEVLTWQD